VGVLVVAHHPQVLDAVDRVVHVSAAAAVVEGVAR
jgi:hypothetical protein